MKKIFLFFILPLALIGLYIIHFQAPRLVTEIKHPLIVSSLNRDLSKTILESIPHKVIEIISFDNLKLKGYLIPFKGQHQKGTIIFLHGIRSGKEQFHSMAKSISSDGYNAVVLDSRAHGESEGVHCTFGVKEKKDVSSIIDYLIKEEHVSDNIGVWGMSLGGAVALQSLAFDDRIKFGIVESTFSSFAKVTQDYAERWIGFKWDFLTEYIVKRACSIADFNAESASPMNIVSEINQPMLLFHGAADQNISIQDGIKNYKAISSKDKKWVPVQNGTHNAMSSGDPQLYLNEISAFLEKVAD